MMMLSYQANDASGQSVEGVIRAGSAEDGLLQLQRQGLSGITLDSSTAVSEPQEIRLLTDALANTGPQLAGQWKALLQRLRWWFGIIFLLLIFGIWKGSMLLGLTSIGLLLLPFVLTARASQHVARYHRYLRAAAFGQRETMHHLASLLQGALKDPLFHFDLAIREAEFVAREQSLDAALAMVERFREPVGQRAPGVFPARQALLYMQADDVRACLAGLREAWRDSGNDPERALDVALFESRSGDLEAAREIFSGIDRSQLSPLVHAFACWTEGILASRSGKDGRVHLWQAVQALAGHERSVVLLASLAVCTCDYALELARHGETAHAQALLERVWPIAEHHLDAATRKKIEATFRADTVPDGSGR